MESSNPGYQAGITTNVSTYNIDWSTIKEVTRFRTNGRCFTVVDCNVVDTPPYRLHTAIREKRKKKEVRSIPVDLKEPSKWRLFDPDNLQQIVAAERFVTLRIYDTPDKVTVHFVKTSRAYNSFQEALSAEGFKSCIPDAETEEAALKVYTDIYPGKRGKIIVLDLDDSR